MIIYVIGNPLVPEDSLPLKFLPDLKADFPEIDFQTADPNENFPPEGETKLTIIDTVKGIREPLILDLEDFAGADSTPVSPHDYDLLFHLLLLKKTGRLDSARIIGVTSEKDYAKIREIISTSL